MITSKQLQFFIIHLILFVLKLQTHDEEQKLLKLTNSLPTVAVDEELWQVEELWHQLLDIVGVAVHGLPCARYGVELAVSHIKPGQITTGLHYVV